MANNELLAAEELEFLLQDAETPSTGEEFANLSHAENARITIRGELDKINLADIFQTLGTSKMEGILRVRNAHEAREIFFHEGQARYRFSGRSEGKRLGQRLIRSGMITPDQLRVALLVQKESGKPLGPILVKHGHVSKADLEKVASDQLQEDLLDLFAWKSGSFEFYKGAPDDTILIERFKQAPAFDIGKVLMEVSSRSEEWERILNTVHGVDEIPIATKNADTSALDADAIAVMRQIDGQQSIRELAETTFLGLYACARLVTRLYNDGFVEIADNQQLLEVAEKAVSSGNTKRAMLAVQAIQEHKDGLTPEMMLAAADVLQRCGQPKLAAKTLLSCANKDEEPAGRIEIAQRARELDPHSIDTLRFLQEEYINAELTDTKAFFDVVSDLGDQLSERGAHNEALQVIGQLKTANVRESAVLSRKARVLHKAKKTSEAVNALLELASIWKGRNDQARLVGVYEQILKIDPNRKDVAKTLKQLKSGKAKRIVKKAVAVLVLIGLLVTGSSIWDHWEIQRKIADTEQRVRDKLLIHDMAGAQELVSAAVAELGTIPELEALAQEISRALRDSQYALRARKLKTFQKHMRLASDHLAAGRIREALVAYAEMLKDRSIAGEVKKSAAFDVKKLRPLLHAQAEALEINMPGPPDELQDDAARERILNALQQHLKGSTPDVALGLIKHREDPTLKAILGEIAHEQLIALAQRLVTLVQTAKLRQREYQAYQAKVDRQRRLDPLYLAAREHERRFEFSSALRLYRRLAKEHPEQDDLKVYFKDQVNRYATIVRFLKLIEKANREGDFKTAQGQYRALRRSYPDIPFGQLVQLPFQVITTPPGAGVRLNGQPVGTAPLLASYYPAARTTVRVELPGFLPEQTIIHGDQVGLVRSTLAKAPDWTFKTQGTVEREPVEDVNGRLYLVDRAGIVYCLDVPNQKELWRFETKDLSGFLTRPRLYGNLALVGSVDGKVRALDRDSGDLVWEREGLPVHGSPAVCGQVLVLATTTHKLVGLKLKKPTAPLLKLMDRDLPSDVRVDIHSVAGTAVLTLHSGVVMRTNTKGEVLWRVTVEGGVATGSSVTPKAVVVATDGGCVTALSLMDGYRLWTQRGLGEVGMAPALGKNRVYVVGRRRATALNLANGKVVKVVHTTATASCAPAEHGGKVFLGDRQGRVLVLDASNLRPLYLLRGDGPCRSPVTALANGTVVTSFDRKQLLVYRRLP